MYKILEQSITGNKKEYILNYGLLIKDIKYIDNNIYFLSNNSINKIVNEKVIKILDVNSPNGFYYDSFSGLIYIICENGKNIFYIDKSSNCRVEILGSTGLNNINKYYSKISISSCDCCIYEGNIYSTYKESHQLVCFKSSDFEVIINKKAQGGYGCSNTLGYCKLNAPEGLCLVNNSIFIADTGNNCIRRLNLDKNTLGTVIGLPNKIGDVDAVGIDARISSPNCMRYSRGLIYFKDNDKIKYITLNNMMVQTYIKCKENEKTVSFDLDNNRKIAILVAYD